MKKDVLRKSIAITLIALLSIIYVMPAIANETIEEKNDITIEFATMDIDKSSSMDKITISENEFKNIQNKLSDLFEELKLQKNSEDIIGVLKNYMNPTDYPILSKILSNLFNFDFIGKRKLVVSYGMGLDLYPLKNSKTAIIKPFTTWLYSDSNSLLPVPSATGILSLNPFKIKTYTGPQFGFMYRFRGIYINIDQPTTRQSYTFFIGTARFIGGFEFTPLSSIF